MTTRLCNLNLSLAFLSFCISGGAVDWPQWLGPERDGVWREEGILENLKESTVRWRTEIGGGYGGPAVAAGRVYLMDRRLPTGASNPSNPFDRGRIPGTERVLCLEEATGKILWQHEYDCPYTISYPAGPRVTPVISAGKVYTLGAEGDLFCFETNRGKILWSKNFRKEYAIETPLWGFSAHPLIDGNKLICLAGGKGSVVVAYDKRTGVEIWRALSAKEPGYCPPMIYEAAGRRQLIIWHPESINSLDPETSQSYWSEPWTVQSALTISTPRKLGPLLFFTAFYNGSKMLRLESEKPGATTVWQSKKVSEKDTDALHSIISTPVFENGYIYGVCSYGQLRCLNAETGERVWETMAATAPGAKDARWANAFLIKSGERFLIFNEKGDLISARLSPKGYEELSRVHVLEPTGKAQGRDVVWSHPAFANGCMFARNDKEIVCLSLNSRSH